MGIKNFNKLLKEYAPNSINEKNILNYKNKTFAIDTSLVLYQYITAIRKTGEDLEDKNGNTTSHIFSILQNVFYFLNKNIKPIYIFDGKAPNLKKITLDKRKKLKENAEKNKINASTKKEEIKYFQRSLYISKKQYDECKKVLDILGIYYIQAEGEADCVCSYLVKNNYVDAAYSEDMDFLTFGCTTLIKKYKANKIIELNLNNILNELNITYDEFINLCILLGTDYAPTIKGIGYKTAYKIIKEKKNIKNFINNNTKFKIPNNYEYDEIIKYYKEKCKIDVNIKFKTPNIEEFKKLLISFNFNEKVIKNYVNKLDNYKFYYQ